MPAKSAHDRCSPNLQLILGDVRRRWPFATNLGCFGDRAVRAGVAPSSHANGAAVDIGFPPEQLAAVVAEMIPFLVARSEELGVQAIHDYRGCRIWRAGRTPHLQDACGAWWRAQRPSAGTGMGQSWANHVHVEVTPEDWGTRTPILARWAE